MDGCCAELWKGTSQTQLLKTLERTLQRTKVVNIENNNEKVIKSFKRIALASSIFFDMIFLNFLFRPPK